MRSFVLASTLLTALVLAASAHAGGWATVELASPPEGVGPGEAWRAELTILRHGVTPTDGAGPTLTIRNVDTGFAETFAAEPTGETGVYEALVVFPEAGEWSYEIDNGLAATGYGESATTTYPAVSIEPGSGSWPVSGSTAPLAALAALLALVVVLFVGARRLGRPMPTGH